MIFTKIRLKNWYSFKDATLDLTYPKKILNNTIDYEYLENYENIKFKRVCIISGANSSGKTSFSKAFCAIRNFLALKEVSSYVSEGQRADNEKVSFEVEFICGKIRSISDLLKVRNDPVEYEKFIIEGLRDEFDHYHSLHVTFDDSEVINSPLKDLAYKYDYVSVPITKKDSIQSLRKKIDDVRNGISVSRSIILKNDDAKDDSNAIAVNKHFISYYFPTAASFIFSDIDTFTYSNQKEKYGISKNILTRILKTFDTSITHVTDSIDDDSKQVKGYYVYFENGKSVHIDKFGDIDSNGHLLSLGTKQSLKLARIISRLDEISDDLPSTCFIDENMANVQSEIEIAMINLIIQKMGKQAQFFYTTHNYEVLDMNLPIHSFVFLKRDYENNTSFIQAEHKFQKNDRSIRSYVKNDILGTLPQTYLIDELIFDEE